MIESDMIQTDKDCAHKSTGDICIKDDDTSGRCMLVEKYNFLGQQDISGNYPF